MKITQGNIEDFFKDAFSEYKEEVNQDLSWFEIDGKVSRNNFFKFSFSGFNIVYLVLIITTFLTTTYLVWQNISSANIKTNETSPENVQYIYDTIKETRLFNKIITKTGKPINDLSDTLLLQQNNKLKMILDSISKATMTGKELNSTRYVKTVDTITKIIIIKPPAIVKRDTVEVKMKN